MPLLPTVPTARARICSLQDKSQSIDVHFNPTSLVYSVENSTPQQSGDAKRRQFAAQFTGKLTMDLQFDTTDTGTDVRCFTKQVAAFLQPSAASTSAAATANADSTGSQPSQNPRKAQPVVCFEWGVYTFQGVMETFRETIDFFSSDGVPLRALVSIGLARQDQVFDDDVPSGSGTSTAGSLVPTGSGSSALSLSTLGGDPSAARDLAAQNGLESLRFTAGASLQVDASVQLKPAAGFAAGAGIGGGLGLSLGAGVSAGISASTGISASASLSAGGPLFGSSASAGVSATQGAFAGLQVRTTASSTARLDPAQMLRSTAGADVATWNGASFSLGGAANNVAGSGFNANVGSGSFSFSRRLTFDSD